MTVSKHIEDNVQILGRERWDIWEQLLTQETCELEGYTYSDGEIWCSRLSLERWRASRTSELHLATIPDVR